MKRFKKLSKKIIFLCSALIVAIAGIFIYSYFFSKPASAAWFNELWLYRTPLTITHNAEVLNNKVKFDIDTATLITNGKMQSDCGDTRFTDINGKLLKYYLDSSGGACNTNSTDYYVLVPKVINGTTVLYHYYGNPSAPNGSEPAQFSEATLTPSGSYAAGSEAQGPGPVGYWKFDDGQGTTAYSSTSIGTSYNSGTGADGACSITDGTVTLDAASSNTCAGRATADAVNYNISTSIAAAATTIDVGATPTGIASGDEVLIINLRGTSGDNSNVGKYETHYVTVSGNVLTLDSPLTNAYDGTTQKIMVQRIPQYTTVTIGDSTGAAGSAVLTTSAYNNTNSEGGVIFFRATGAVTIDTDGKIDGASKGYAGGSAAAGGGMTYNGTGGVGGVVGGAGAGGQGGGGGSGQRSGTQLSGGTGTTGGAGGGGGQDSRGGGGGGGYGGIGYGGGAYYTGAAGSNGSGTTGGNGGDNGTQNGSIGGGGGGGTYGSADLSQLYFGSGGAAGGRSDSGSGGAGGGIIYIAGNSITVSGSISTNGGSAADNNYGASGGGAGGSVYIKAAATTLGSSLVTASAGSGGAILIEGGAGGNGGVGRIAVVYNSSSGTTSPSANTSTVAALTNGTLAGTTKPAWQTEDRCVAGKCLYFDGSTSNVTVGTAINDIKTISFWVRPTSVTSSAFIDFDGGTHKITVSSGTISATGFTSPTIYVNGRVSSTLTANTWQHVAITTGTSFDSNASLVIGKSFTTYLNGFMDDVKIYPYARTAAQVKTDYNAGAKNASANSGTSAVLGSSTEAWLSDGLVGYWKMDEASWNGTAAEVKDASGNGNNGAAAQTGSGNGIPSTTTGKFGNGGSFTGDGANPDTNGQYVQVANSTSLNSPSTELTLSAWVNLTSAPSNVGTILVKGNVQGGASNRQYYTYVDSSRNVTFSVGSGSSNSNYTTTSTISTSTWTHIVATFNAGTQAVYFNGVVQPGAQSGSITSIDQSNTNPLNIGEDAYTTRFGFTGKIDEARVYNRALSPKEVSDLYHWAPGPVGYWDFEEGGNIGVGSTAFDRSTSANPGIWKGSGAHTAPGKFGKAGKFDGSSDYIRVNSSSNWDYGANNFSIDFWIKPDTSQNGPVMGRRWTNRSWMVYLQGTSLYLSASSDGTNWDIFSSTLTATVTNNVWQHVAYVRSGSNWYVYLNGVRVTSLTSSSTVYAGSEPLHIGADSEGATWYYSKGLLDEIKIYKYARTQKQIVSDMNAGHPNVGSPVGSAVGHWKFDEGQGITANNSGGGSGLNGTLTTMASPATATSGWTQAGRFGKGLAFDGGSDYVNLGDSKFLYDEVTVSFWTNNIGHASNTQYATYFIARESDDDGCGVYYDNDNDKIRAFCTIGGVAQNLAESNTTTDTGWHQITAIFSGSSGRKLYKDGVLVGSDATYTQSFDDLSSTNTYIGRGRTLAATEYVYGTIDEPKIYNYALTASEILTDYNRGSSLVLGALGSNSSYPSNSSNQEYCIPGDSSTCTAPVGRWDFEQGKDNTCSGGTNDVCDTSGNGYDGAWNGTGAKHWDTGKIGKGGKFNGTDDYVSTASLNPSGLTGLTISFWIKTTATTGVPFSWADYRFCRIGLTANKMNCSVDGGSTGSATTTTSINDGKWHHIALTSSSNSQTIYVDGKSEATASETLDTANSGAINIGRDIGATLYTNATIDSVRYFNYARSAAQVAYDYNKGAPVGHWKFDECQGATAYDSSGNKNNGTITIGATDEATIGTCTTSSTAWGSGATGKRNASLSFDGDDDYVDLGTASTLQNSVFSISAWIKPTAVNVRQTVFDNGSVLNTSTRIAIETTGKIRFFLTNVRQLCASNTALTANVWTQVSVTYDSSSGACKVYLNGALDGSATDAATMTYTSPKFVIGDEGGAFTEPFGGLIDDVRVYNYALTAAQVKDIMNNGAINFAPSTGSP